MAKPALLAGFAVLVVGAGASLQSSPAYGQDLQLRPWLRNLFSPRRAERVEEPPSAVPQKQQPRTQAPAARKNVVRARPAEPAPPPAPVVEKASDARVVLVVGDFLASGLADGLTTVFAENPAVRVVDRSNGSSGFVRDDYYNWPGEIGPILETEKPAVVLVMMGSNDRQQMKVGDGREAPRTEGWTQEYKQRTVNFGKHITEAKLPFLWVGMPSFRPGTMTSDMLALNEIYRDAAETAGGEFVDIWEGFVDENGAFITRGPDINGQPVTLRAEDGINMTRAGKRKVAFYTEKPLLKLLGLASPNATTADPVLPAPIPGSPDSPQMPVNIDRTPPMLLSDPALDGGTELLGASLPTKDAPAKKEQDTREAGKVSPGRADDFTWPPQRTTATTSPQETTGSVTLRN
ncbi:DUF459 domain-containing protein [Aquamicrobium sp.]|uniref:SGNH/GDSL hydrolase family protein n=1 Tax=Aquamicrobium sp. TaxID=1872579 RepID=UPI00258593E7|nr:DUF459 domain-containing protein [Aquamicrobium sp.]MCK9552180.1 DUF459 domain-containing protein [Aquamicrobium sp.]